MAFSEQFLQEGRQELTRLEDERRVLDSRIAALRQLLGSASQPVLPMEVAKVESIATASTMTFAEIVSRFIRLHPGIKVREITRHLKAQNFPINGQTDIGHRVYNEVWRLKKHGKVVQTPEGGYRLA